MTLDAADYERYRGCDGWLSVVHFEFASPDSF